MSTIMQAASQPATQIVAAVSGVTGIVAGLVVAKVCCCVKNGGKKSCGCKDSKRPMKKEFKKEIRHTHPAPTDGSVELYVGNLSYDMTEEQLLKEFEAFGKVTSARIISNRFNNRSKGFGFVIMPNRAEAEKAIAALNDKDFLGRPMKVNEARNLIK